MTQTFNPIIADERRQTINGIEGRYMGATMRHDEKPGCFCKQRWVTSKTIQYYGEPHQIKVKIRFDDDCRNGHNSFSITGEVNSFDRRLRDRTVCCGCIHDEIAEHFPELAPLIKWHLVSSDGPLHYVANTTYHAGDLDFARNSAVWPEATDEQLSLPKDELTKLLEARLPALIAEFRATIEGIGFLWERGA